MPTLKFMNLGSVAKTPGVSAEGNLYALQVVETLPSFDDSPPPGDDPENPGTIGRITRTTTFALDLRRTRPSPVTAGGSPKKSPIPALPRFREITAKKPDAMTRFGMRERDVRIKSDEPNPISYDEADQVYLIDLVGDGEDSDPESLRYLFPRANITRAPRGSSQWFLSSIEDGYQNIMRTVNAVEETEWTESSERMTVGFDAGVGSFEIFFFPSLEDEKSASVLISGETGGKPFSFFLGNPTFKRILPGNRVKDLNPGSCHILSAGTWRAFYSVAEAKSSLLPVKTAHKG